MLENMFIGDPVGTYDRILDFSTAVTGGPFFVPSQDFLDDPDGELTEAGLGNGGAASAKVGGPDIDDGSDVNPAGVDVPEDSDGPTDADPSAPTDGSLGIGSLNRRRQ